MRSFFTAFLKMTIGALLLLITFAAPTFAQTPSTNSGQIALTSLLPSSVSPASPLYTDMLVHNMFHSFSCLAIGQSTIGQPCLTYQVTKNAQGAIQSVPVLSSADLSGGALGATTSLIGALYMNPPVRTADYLASVGQGLGIVKEANAQVIGSGAAVLNPILTLWQVSRNISYVIMIIIFIVIGLMVMFRNRINPQTVITAQAALPGLVIGLILITFSYFLAGLIADTAFIGVNVVGYYFSSAQPGAIPKLSEDITAESAASIFSRFVGEIGNVQMADFIDSIMRSLNSTVNNWLKIFAGIAAYQVGSNIGGPIGGLGGIGVCAATGIGAILGPFCGAIGSVVGGVTLGTVFGGSAMAMPAGSFGWALYFISIAVLIYTLFRLLLRLINSYLTIIFLTISAPFQFLFASLPGRQGVATEWILNMLGNVLAFPAVFAVFYFVSFLFGPQSDGGRFFGITNQFNPAGNQTFPLFGGMNLSFIRLLLAFGALLATPAIPDIIIRGVGKASQAGQLIGQEISGGTRGGQGYYGQVTGGAGRITGTVSQAGTVWYGPTPPTRSAAGELWGAGVNLPKFLRPKW